MLRAATVVLACLALPAAAQTFVVDAQGGAGSHFRDLPAAIAAVPSGATLLVRPGAYSPFTLTKALSVLGEQRDQVVVNAASAVRIGPLARADRVHVSQVSLAGLAVLEVIDALGPVVLERVRFDTVMGAVTVQRSRCVQILACEATASLPSTSPVDRIRADASSIHLHDTLLVGQGSLPQTFGRHQAGAGLWLRASDAFLTGCAIGGGRGGPPITFTGFAGHGGHGVVATGAARVFATATICAGGGGGDDPLAFGGGAGDGGSGLVLDAATSALVEAVAPWGGAGGWPNGRPGAPAVVDSTSQLAVDRTATAVQARVDTPSTSSVRFSVVAPAQSVAVLLLGVQPTHVPLGALAPGALLVEPLAGLGPLAVGASGEASITLSASLWPKHVPLYGQLVVQAGRLRPTNSVAFVAR